jgi:hypothetical protein
MVPVTGAQRATIGPRRKADDENVDVPAKRNENEPVEIEREAPAEYNQPMEQVDNKKNSNSPAFEE